MISRTHLTISVWARRDQMRWGYELAGLPSQTRMVCGRLTCSTIGQLEAYGILHALSTVTDTLIQKMLDGSDNIGPSGMISVQIRSMNLELIQALRRGTVSNRICPEMLKLTTWNALLNEFRRFKMRFTVAEIQDVIHVRGFVGSQLYPLMHSECPHPDVVSELTRDVTSKKAINV